MNVEQTLDYLRDDKSIASHITEWRVIPPRPARFAGFPDFVHPRIIEGLRKLHVNDLYTHQRQAIESVHAGEDVVVVTPTASGKTICYNVPVLDAIVRDNNVRALYIFPTKALSQDQLDELNVIINGVDLQIGAFTFDGDTPVSARKAIRSAGHIVVTNPDMLHTGILPHHTIWIKLFENLKYVVIDEIHHYRGVFGSHLANVVRRLKRICDFYGSNPQFIMCSATIANPLELAEQIVEKKTTLVDDNGAPSGEKHFILYNPPIVNRQLGIRRSYVSESSKIAAKFFTGDTQTIVFARSRLRVEILLTYLKKAASRARKSKGLVRGYRGGYLPLERREIEKGLRDGDIMAVVSTNALELGIDIGSLDACVMAGYSGSIASTWQQAGRAGRRTDVSVAVLVASSAPLDQYIVNHPQYFFGQSPEHGIVNPNNLIILASHLKCAAFELPFVDGEGFGLDANSTAEILSYLEEQGVLRHVDGKWHWMSQTYPAEGVSLRTASPENVVIIDTTDQARVIGEVDYPSAPLLVHEGAIYLHEGKQYSIERLDLDDKKAYAAQVDADYFTDAQLKTEVKVLSVARSEPAGAASKHEGEVSVTWLPTMYKKVKFGTHENVGVGEIHLDEQEMHTTSYWIEFGEDVEQEISRNGVDLGESLHSLANVLVNVAPIQIMCDPRDIRAYAMVRSPFSDRPTIHIYDSYPGGVGFSHKIFVSQDEFMRAARDLIENCECAYGCPSCVGPTLEVGKRGKEGALRLIAGVLGPGDARRETPAVPVSPKEQPGT